VFLWPNTLLQLTADGLSVLQVLPLATGLCTYRESRYALPDTAREMQLLRYLQRRVRRQALQADARLLARVQQGMASGLEPGPIAVNEPGLRWFAARYREQMGGQSGPEPGAVARRGSRPKRRAVVGA
jgi:phenylpropionate dioxygenase-like ring-hydroxylating dioxygenase large terminal subunit